MTEIPSGASGNRYDLRVSGDMDLHTTPPIEGEGLTALADPGITTLFIDLREVTFIDSTGIGTLVRLRVEAESHHKHLVLTAPSEPVLRVLTLTSLTHAFTID